MEVISGVPQDSVMRHYYTTYMHINDIVGCIQKFDIPLFVDDTLHKTGKDISEIVNCVNQELKIIAQPVKNKLGQN